MGDEETADRRRADLAPFQVNDELLGAASERVIAMYCSLATPARRSAQTRSMGSAPPSGTRPRIASRHKALLERLLS